MNQIVAHPFFIALLVASVLGTPVTYRGGAAEPHAHNFLQLWHDAALGTFSHDAHTLDQPSHSSHDHAMDQETTPQQPLIFDDAPDLTVSPFVVSDWGVPALNVPSSSSLAGEQARRVPSLDRTVLPASRPAAPEPPPPRPASN